MGALANGESGNGSLSAVEMPERVTAPQDEPQPIEEEFLVADTWEELDAAYKMDPAYEYPPEYGKCRISLFIYPYDGATVSLGHH